MRIPIPTRKSYRRKGSGRKRGDRNGGSGKIGGGGGGGELDSGKSILGGGDELRVPDVDGLPEDRDETTTNGESGGIPTEVGSGRFKESRLGGGTRSQVYGTGHRPSAPISNATVFGFMSVAPYLEAHNIVGCYPDLDCYSLLQDKTRPGGEVVEMTITTKTNDSVLFFFISDSDSAMEVQGAIQGNCSDVTVGDPIPFNSTNNLQLDTVVQYYRGDSAAILLRGYDSTRESSGSPNFTSFPPSVNMSTWGCLNYTIGESIPLMGSGLSQSTAGLGGSPFFSLPG